ncbi:DivIVA domain-containing protein [Salinibacterium xinjiangense]|uniref:Cell wall synthesis protein Wag31 n=1 Tax=Salinibacterium xinjiangense TaxID=386302 RepID=A0A2C8ZUG8_9MICO|nr:DivIVA domain-containing protein [Salinibacterium xinjiangense]SOE69187.1 DivIVA domain-containing protein [Salinibacterium xinjiangense]
MALTPEDVVNKRFQPTKFREGYDQDEVDDFLDEVVVELRRLNQENEELRQRLIASDSRINDLQRSGAQDAPAQATPSFVQQPEPVAIEPAPVPASAPAAVQYAPTSSIDTSDTGGTNNLLQLARRLHEEHVREGVEKRDALIAEGHATAARIVEESESGHRAQIETLDQERQKLEHRVDELRNFEREYRQKLKGYIESQLRELDIESNVLTSSQGAASAFIDAPESDAAEFADASAGTDHQAQDGKQPPANFPGFAGN